MDCLVSVIVPVHNTVEYLPRCIDSIRNQSLKDIEIILVENQSNDGSAALCDEYMSFDSRVKVLHLPVANASIARNAGLDIASAPYVGFVDSDDLIMEDYCSHLLSIIGDADIAVAGREKYIDNVYDKSKTPSQVITVSGMEALKFQMLGKTHLGLTTKDGFG